MTLRFTKTQTRVRRIEISQPFYYAPTKSNFISNVTNKNKLNSIKQLRQSIMTFFRIKFINSYNSLVAITLKLLYEKNLL